MFRLLAVPLLALLAGTVVAAPAPTSEMIGGWHYQIDTDAMTDAPRYTAYLKADESDNAGDLVVLMCPKAKQLQIGIKFAAFTGNKRGMRPFLYRFDDKGAVAERWNYLGGNVVGKQVTGLADGFLAALAHAQRLRVRAFRTDGVEVNAAFTLGDPAPALARLAADCKLAPRP